MASNVWIFDLWKKIDGLNDVILASIKSIVMFIELILFSNLVQAPLQIAVPTSVLPIGQVSFQATKSQIIVPATVNGKDLHMLFDTGFAGDVLIDSSLDFGKPTGTATLQDFVGSFQAPVYKIESIQLGTMKVNPKDRQAIAQPGISDFGNGFHVDGLMGLSVIKSYVTEISFQNHKFEFFPNSVNIAIWKADGINSYLLKMLPLGARAIDLPVTTSTGQQMIMALDTGNSFYATTHKDVLERVGMWPASKVAKFQSLSGVASGPVASWEKEMKGLTIFGVSVPKSYWDIIDLPAADTSSDGTVGFQFLKNFNIFFDFQRRYVYLQKIHQNVENKPEGSIGIAAVYNPAKKAIEIFHVSKGSPADIAGIKNHDLILQVNDDDNLSGNTFEKLRNKVDGKVGTKVRLAISHDGFVQTYTLTRVALINH